MQRSEIEDQIAELKSDYIRISSDLEKLDSVGGNTANGEKQLAEIEEKIAHLRKKL
ncbi:SE1832 family protein [Gracilibacillus sp. YIM 98692]|uniref:SE1832 family protein n=1 Tax=Gracilibacillus sp. YIM 98692 TaxID=2663532 RepID=UPI0013D4D797|nr:SE1832 family protein [Gracilibacillus sp. YIM 98692]